MRIKLDEYLSSAAACIFQFTPFKSTKERQWSFIICPSEYNKNGISTSISSQICFWLNSVCKIENGSNTHISHIPFIFSFHYSLACNVKIFTFYSSSYFPRNICFCYQIPWKKVFFPLKKEMFWPKFIVFLFLLLFNYWFEARFSSWKSQWSTGVLECSQWIEAIGVLSHSHTLCSTQPTHIAISSFAH